MMVTWEFPNSSPSHEAMSQNWWENLQEPLKKMKVKAMFSSRFPLKSIDYEYAASEHRPG